MADQFCAACVAESTDETAGSYREGMFGREFRGRARPCATCGSYVATLWRLLLYFPLTPVGTYRYLHAKTGFGGTKFFSRKVPLDPEQVRKTRISGTITALLILVAVGVYIWWRRSK